MKQLLTNVVLDVVLQREPWVASSYALWQARDQQRLVGLLLLLINVTLVRMGLLLFPLYISPPPQT